MESIKVILSELDFSSNDYEIDNLNKAAVYKLVLSKSGYNEKSDSLYNLYKSLASKSITRELLREDNYNTPDFSTNAIKELITDKDDELYKSLFEFHFGKLNQLESYRVDNSDYIKGDNFNIEYHLFLELIATLITADLNLVLEKVKRKVFDSVKPKEWYNLFLSNDHSTEDQERIDNIVQGVLM